MAVDYEQLAPSKYVYLPKVGQEADFDIDVISPASNPKFNFKRKRKVTLPDGAEAEVTDDVGYYIQATLKNGKILSVTNEAAFKSVFARHNINDGDRVHVNHPEKGKWEVTKLSVTPKGDDL